MKMENKQKIVYLKPRVISIVEGLVLKCLNLYPRLKVTSSVDRATVTLTNKLNKLFKPHYIVFTPYGKGEDGFEITGTYTDEDTDIEIGISLSPWVFNTKTRFKNILIKISRVINHELLHAEQDKLGIVDIDNTVLRYTDSCEIMADAYSAFEELKDAGQSKREILQDYNPQESIQYSICRDNMPLKSFKEFKKYLHTYTKRYMK